MIGAQVIPRLGSLELQKLRPADIAACHAALLKAGGKEGRPLSPQTVQHCHRVLNKALSDACRHELVARNVATLVSPPKVQAKEMEILSPDEVKAVLAAMRDTTVFPRVAVLLSTGAQRGELMGLKWSDLDLDDGKVETETRFYITSLALLANALGPMIRSHWMVENGLHWVLDMIFRDDECRVRTDNPFNLAIIKHIALNVLRTRKSKDSLRVRRKVAAWDENALAAYIAA